jgi:hypothetical protein
MGYLSDVVADAKGTYSTGGKQIPLEGDVLSPADASVSDEISAGMTGFRSDDEGVTVEVPLPGDPRTLVPAQGPVIRDDSGVQDTPASHESGVPAVKSDSPLIEPSEGMFDSLSHEPEAAGVPDVAISTPEHQWQPSDSTSPDMPPVPDESDSPMDGIVDNPDNFMTAEVMGSDSISQMDESEQTGDTSALITSKAVEMDTGYQRPDSHVSAPVKDELSIEAHQDSVYEDHVESAENVNPSVDRVHRRAIEQEGKDPDVQVTPYRSTGTSPAEERLNDTGERKQEKKQEKKPSISAAGQDDPEYQYSIARSVPGEKGAFREDIPSVETVRTESRNTDTLQEKGPRTRTTNDRAAPELPQNKRAESGKQYKDNIPARQRVKQLMQQQREHRGESPELTTETNRGKGPQSSPKVVIGNVDVVIETEKAQQTSERPARAESVGLSSRYYLRRL